MHSRKKDLSYYLNHKAKRRVWALIPALVLFFSSAAGGFVWTHPQVVGYQSVAIDLNSNSVVNTFYRHKHHHSLASKKFSASQKKRSVAKPSQSLQLGNYIPPPSALLPLNIFDDGQLCSINCRPVGAINGDRKSVV